MKIIYECEDYNYGILKVLRYVKLAITATSKIIQWRYVKSFWNALMKRQQILPLL